MDFLFADFLQIPYINALYSLRLCPLCSKLCRFDLCPLSQIACRTSTFAVLSPRWALLILIVKQ